MANKDKRANLYLVEADNDSEDGGEGNSELRRDGQREEADAIEQALGGRRQNYYEHDPEIEYEQRKLADESGHNKYASREKPLVIQDKKRPPGGDGNPLQSHPAMTDSAYGQGRPPALADVLSNPQALDQLMECDPDNISPQLKQQLAQKLGYEFVNRLEKNKKSTPSAPVPF